jgi:antitoxin CcdA
LTKQFYVHSFMRMNVHRKISVKKAVNLSIDAELLTDSRAMGLNLSKVLEEKLRELRVAEFKRQIAPEIKFFNDHIEKHGLWSDGLRLF